MSQDKIIAFALILLSLIGIFLSFFDPINNLSGSKRDQEKSQSFFDNSSLLSKKNRILSLSLDGLISEESAGSTFTIGKVSSQAVQVREQLIKALNEESIKGVLIRINSPGGTVGISQEIYRAIIRLRKKKPVIATIGDIAASGGYYIASACNYIFANPGSLTGSIGVISHFYNLEETYKKLGVKSITIKAGKYKDIGSPDRPMTREEKALWEEILYDTYDQFTEDVYQGRKASSKEYGKLRNNLTRQQVQNFSEGLIFSGSIGKQIGLIDYLGGKHEALKKLQATVKKKSKNKIKTNLPVVDSVNPAGSLFEKLKIKFLLDQKISLSSLVSERHNKTNHSQVCSIINQPVLLIWNDFFKANSFLVNSCK